MTTVARQRGPTSAETDAAKRRIQIGLLSQLKQASGTKDTIAIDTTAVALWQSMTGHVVAAAAADDGGNNSAIRSKKSHSSDQVIFFYGAGLIPGCGHCHRQATS